MSATTDLTDTREVLTADDGGTTVRVVVDSYTLTAADEISEQMAPAEHRGAIIGIPAIVSFDADGERIGAEFEDLAAPVAEQLLALDDARGVRCWCCQPPPSGPAGRPLRRQRPG